MALINCPECQTEVSDKAASCIKCGYPIAATRAQPTHQDVPDRAQQSQQLVVSAAKSRGVYIILGLLFGGLGLHNFYAGQNTRGALKAGVLLVTLVLDFSTRFYTGFFVVWMVLCAAIALVEIIITSTDATGAKMT